MKIEFGKYAKTANKDLTGKVYENEYGKVYLFRLPFSRFVVLTFSK